MTPLTHSDPALLLCSSMGYCILFVHGLNKLCAGLSRCGATSLMASTVLLLLLFSWKTVKQNEIWLSRESLFRYDRARKCAFHPALLLMTDLFPSEVTRVRHFVLIWKIAFNKFEVLRV